MENKIEVKEEYVVPDIVLKNEEQLPMLNLKMQNNSAVDVFEMETKVEIKKELRWHRTSPEVKWQQNTFSVSELQVQNKNRDGENKDFPSAESPRLYAEAACSTCFTNEDLQKNYKVKLKMERVTCEKAKVCEVYGSDVMETSCIVQSVYALKSKKPETVEQNEQGNRFSDNSRKHHVCEVCGKSFTLKRSFRSHMLIHEGIRPHKCDVCEKYFTNRSNLKNHILIHQGKRPYKCDICEKYFTQKSSLKTHILIHEGKRQYRCNVCGKCFTQSITLKNHILIHEGKRPHKCDICEKCFTDRGNLKRHILIHEGKKSYMCDVCKKCFSERCKLKRHIFSHEGNRPYKCEVCQKLFTNRSNLKRHILIHVNKVL